MAVGGGPAGLQAAKDLAAAGDGASLRWSLEPSVGFVDVTVPEGGAEGVLFSMGGNDGGFVFADATAAQLASEIESYSEGDRVHAYEYSTLELLRRFVGQNKAASVAALVVAAAVLAHTLGAGEDAGELDLAEAGIRADDGSRRGVLWFRFGVINFNRWA